MERNSDRLPRTIQCTSVVSAIAALALTIVGLPPIDPAAAQAPAPAPVARPRGGLVQFGIRRLPGQADSDQELIEGLFLPVDRETTRQLEKARQLLEDARYSDAAMLLDEILQRDEDCFFKPRDDQPLHRSLKAEAQRLIGNMPPQGLKAYELQFGARAAQMLSRAAASGDVAGLEEVARRFFHTKAGYEATLLLGRRHLDHGRPLAAALCLQRVRETPQAAAAFEPGLSVLLATSWWRAGDADHARAVLIELKKNHPKAAIRIGQKTLNLFNDDTQAIAWLTSALGKPRQVPSSQSQQWLVFRGDSGRNAASAGGMPLLNPRWRVPTTNHPALENALLAMRARFVEQGIAALPSMHPLAVGDLVLMRTARNLLAVDFVTGKRVAMPSSGFSSDELLPGTSLAGSGRSEAQINPALVDRFWNDATFGTFSSDGEQVYIVDELEIAADPTYVPPPRNRLNRRGGNPQSLFGSSFNKLAAHELRSEVKLKWSVGGAGGDDEPRLAGAFFLGPPLPLQGKLYALVEIKSEIKLVVLDPASGRLEWSQQVAVVEQNVGMELVRRLAGCTPSYADGVLVCPTAAGAVVAVDLANRSLLWGYQYPRSQQVMQNPMMPRVGVAFQNGQWVQTGADEHWNDATATIAEGRVLVTPPESDDLHCLNLLDGAPLWKRPRSDYLYVAAVHDGNAVLVGKHNLTALKLADGSPAWHLGVVDLPADSMPSGRGFLSGDSYYLPLTSAEVVRVDLAQAKITARQKSRRGTIPGNLICYRGEVISQGVDYLETFFQIEPLQNRIAEALAKNADDPWALAHRGELALEEGRVPQAIADVRRSYRADPAPFTRDLLVEALLAGLAEDFTAHRDAIGQLEQLATLPSQRTAYLRTVAAGLQRAGDNLGALDAYLKLASVEPQSEELESVDATLSVVRERWIRSRFNELMAQARPADRAKIDAAVRERLEQAVAANNVRMLRQDLACFGDHPAADAVRQRLVEQLSGPETLLEREQLLRSLERSGDATGRKAAMARLAGLLREAGRPHESLAYYRRIEAEFGDQPVLEKKSVREILADLPADSPLRRAMSLERQWAAGEVKIEKAGSRTQRPPPQGRTLPIEIRGEAGPFFENVTIGFDQQPQQLQIVGRDGLGQERFRVGLNEAGRAIVPPQSVPFSHATVLGHALVVCSGAQMIGMDTLRASPATGSRMLWKQDLVDSPLTPYNVTVVPNMQGVRPWTGARDVTRQGPQVRAVGQAADSGIVMLRGRELCCIDVLSGRLLWVLRGLPQGSDVFGDDDYVLVAPPDDGPAMLVRALDGKLLGSRRVPPAEQRWTAIGRRLLITRNAEGGDKLIVALYDPYVERELWSQSFHSGCRGALVEGESLAMMQPDGKFSLLALDDGHKIIDEQLQPEQSLQGIYMLRSAGGDFLVTSRPFTGRAPNRTNLSPLAENTPLVTGHVYAFDRATHKPLWDVPASVDQHGLLLNQPSELPVLTFIRNINNFARPNRTEMKGSILCLDKRTGRLVHEDDEVQQIISAFEAVGDLEEQTVTLLTSTQTVTLRFTDSPVAPEPPYQAGMFDKPKPPSNSNKASALLRALGIGVQPGGPSGDRSGAGDAPFGIPNLAPKPEEK